MLCLEDANLISITVVEGLFSQQKFPAISTGEAVGEWINLPQLAVVSYQSTELHLGGSDEIEIPPK